MERKVLKYILNTCYEQDIMMVRGAEILHIEVKDNMPCLWVLAVEGAGEELRHFRSYFTDEMIPTIHACDKYIGTYILYAQVYHVFEG